MTIEIDSRLEYYMAMEARIAKLEAAVEFIQRNIRDLKEDVHSLRKDLQTDFRILFGAIMSVALSLSAIMAKGFGWL
jgi:hypothetical protein